MFLIIDYDETYTEDSKFWDEVIQLAKQRGHRVICCTNRLEEDTDNFDVEEDMNRNNINIVYSASFKNKVEAVSANYSGAQTAIWIANSPDTIY